MRVTPVADAKSDLEADRTIRVRHVGKSLGNERLIGDQVFDAVTRVDLHVARPQGSDPAERAAQGNDISRLDRSVQQNNEAADQVRGRLLQAKADAEPDRA